MTAIVQDPNDSWNTDWTNFTNDSDQYNAYVAAYQQDLDSYKSVLNEFNELCKQDPEKAFIYFMTVVLSSTNPDNHANIEGLQQDQVSIVGQQMKTSADMTQLTNDLQHMFNTTDPKFDPNNPGADKALVQTAYKDINQLINTLSDPNSNESKAIGSDARTQLLSGLNNIKTNIENNFNLDGQPYDKNKMDSFEQMNYLLGQKTDPNSKIDAQGAMKGFTDANQLLTADLQNVNASLKQQISLVTGRMSSWQSFGSSIMKDYIDQINSSLQNEKA